MLTHKFVRDPFAATEAQQELASEMEHEMHLLGNRRSLTIREKKIKEILGYIDTLGASKLWSERGRADAHWDDCTRRAIAGLQALGFTTNADIQKFLNKVKNRNE